MNQNEMDEEFIMGEGEPPTIMGCLLHPRVMSNTTYTASGTGRYIGAIYGLCDECEELLNIDDLYQWVIDAEIKKRLKNLSKDI